MDQHSIAIILLLGSFFVLMMIRIPIAFALIIASLLTALYIDIPTVMLIHKMINGLNNFTFLAVPFFILAGQMMAAGGIADRLVRFADTLVGRKRGGLAQVNIVSSTMFGGISGSSVADVASIGSFLIPSMVKRGHTPEYSVAVTISSSVQGVLIPPSQNMIYYSLAAGGLSLEALFLGGYVPGLMLGVSLMILAWVIAVKERHPRGKSYSLKEALAIGAEASIGLFTIVIIIGGIVAGIFTATESAAVAVVYATLVVVFVYKSMGFRSLVKVLDASLSALATVIALIMASSGFAFLLSVLEVPILLSDFVLSLSESRIVTLLCINLLLLVLGALMDMGVLILLLTPILLPIAEKLGVDPIHFGVIMLVNLGIGVCTPPVGSSLLVGCSIGRVSIEKTVLALLPFYLVMVGVLMLITFFPQLTLFLPNLFSG